jgi:hypothetical protein
MKGELLEGGLRIPAIARWAARIPAGAVWEQVMISMDWLPTLFAVAGDQPDPSYPPDGDNLLPILTGRAPPHPRKLIGMLQNVSFWTSAKPTLTPFTPSDRERPCASGRASKWRASTTASRRECKSFPTDVIQRQLCPRSSDSLSRAVNQVPSLLERARLACGVGHMLCRPRLAIAHVAPVDLRRSRSKTLLFFVPRID